MSDRGKFYFYASTLWFDKNFNVIEEKYPIKFSDILNVGMFKEKVFIYPSLYFLIIAIRNYHNFIVGRKRIFIDAKTYGYISKTFLEIKFNRFNIDSKNNLLDFYKEGFETLNRFSVFLFSPRGDSDKFAKLIRSGLK